MVKISLVAAVAGVSLSGVMVAPASAAGDVPAAPPGIVYARPAPAAPAGMPMASNARRNLGGGLLELLFSGGAPQHARTVPFSAPDAYAPQTPAGYRQEARYHPEEGGFDPKYEKQLVAYHGKERPGTIVIDTPNKFLYLVEGDGMALRYGIGVGRPGFTWSGIKTISAKKEWPDWTPPPEMLARRPDLPRHMEGGPANPLGARALYLGSSLYRIHGSNEPWTIGTNVSSGCIRMRNQDVIDLYERVRVGTRVVVL
jgi:lipoprotein-anchoring transpeptidase ErfK/SrfK